MNAADAMKLPTEADACAVCARPKHHPACEERCQKRARIAALRALAERVAAELGR